MVIHMRSKVISARIVKSPKKKKKWRAIVERADGTTRTVDFGASKMDDYTTHYDAHRMARYVARHGGQGVNLEATKRHSPHRVHRDMSRVTRSDRESWNDPETPGYWSRWYLWNEPSLRAAARAIKKRDGIRVVT